LDPSLEKEELSREIIGRFEKFFSGVRRYAPNLDAEE